MDFNPDIWQELLEGGDVPEIWNALGNDPPERKLARLVGYRLDLDCIPEDAQQELVEQHCQNLLPLALEQFGIFQGHPDGELFFRILTTGRFESFCFALSKASRDAWTYFHRGPGSEDHWPLELHLAVVESSSFNCAADVFYWFDGTDDDDRWGTLFDQFCPDMWSNLLLMRMLDGLSWRKGGEIYQGLLISRSDDPEVQQFLHEKAVGASYPGQLEVCDALGYLERPVPFLNSPLYGLVDPLPPEEGILRPSPPDIQKLKTRSRSGEE